MIDLNKLTSGKQLTNLEKDILRYVVENISDIQDMGVRAVAKETFTSPASVIRLSKKLGYSGFTDMYYSLLPLVKKSEYSEGTSESLLLSQEISSLFVNCSQETMDTFIRTVLMNKEKYIFLYATGFSKIIAEYMYKKLLTLGKKAMLASGSDSVGIFENNLNDIAVMIVVSRSGETEQVYEKLKKASEAGIFTISITQESENRIAKLSDLNIQIHDSHKLDDRNLLPNLFFPGVLLSFELIIERYLNQ
ncbi:MurR/RpiR family transcriptional regulator [Alkalibacterium olivapovliticus]|uniref:DNA-binding MurR/RpiR family transcriptional regulator n=1 Tax=Alkalibacterium olivapovliticus TaxID=99907 RepID=A0A2T0W8Y4_9LACT|nr:MurR/RpiR family transcriptional regulator [Alkalibacterium olivapovliticus]PRY83167.1 DNA-binding MurR/RpiR family transcriptional regulator [Alkalibacterium olivapovliticus]